ncbi:MAG: HPr(Ser) kinase/phosphatase [Oscillospiraceae bacterium]|nr:HPr(Ser) kinase/phosphatase [Oscillospiraceae bacterium]
MERSYKLSRLAEELEAEIVYKSKDFEEVTILTGDVHRPGLQLAGFYEHFEPRRVQLIGRMEAAYMEKLTQEERSEKWDALLKYKSPALIMCHGAEAKEDLISVAKVHDVTILQKNVHTTDIMWDVIRIVKRAVAPSITMHGVLVEVYGIGLLLTGESGIGKSEAAIELLKRGHRLIADDAVEIKAIDKNVIEGTAPELIRHYVELRGIGVVDVSQIFGVGAIKAAQNIHLVVDIVPWEDGAVYDRLGLDEETTNILGVDVPIVTIPVKPGRNLAVILEVAAMNQRQKLMGYNSAMELTKQINNNFEFDTE